MTVTNSAIQQFLTITGSMMYHHTMPVTVSYTRVKISSQVLAWKVVCVFCYNSLYRITNSFLPGPLIGKFKFIKVHSDELGS